MNRLSTTALYGGAVIGTVAAIIAELSGAANGGVIFLIVAVVGALVIDSVEGDKSKKKDN